MDSPDLTPEDIVASSIDAAVELKEWSDQLDTICNSLDERMPGVLDETEELFHKIQDIFVNEEATMFVAIAACLMVASAALDHMSKDASTFAAEVEDTGEIPPMDR